MAERIEVIPEPLPPERGVLLRQEARSMGISDEDIRQACRAYEELPAGAGRESRMVAALITFAVRRKL